MGYGKKARQSNEKANKAFGERYGMSRKEWSIFKKEDPKKAHELRLRVQNPIARS